MPQFGKLNRGLPVIDSYMVFRYGSEVSMYRLYPLFQRKKVMHV
jgi:hypothetical protein